MAPSWPPKSKQNRKQIDAKIDRKNDASWNRFLEGFWSIFGSKMEACWHQNRPKIDANFEERFFEKSYSRCSGGSIFQVRGVQVGSKNRSKMGQKMESRWEGILASIFNGFWWTFGGKLGGKMEPRSIPRGIEKAIEKWKAPRWPQNRNKTF